MDNYGEYKLLEQSKLLMIDQLTDRLLDKLHEMKLESIITENNGWVHFDGYLWPRISKKNKSLLKDHIDPLIFKAFRWLHVKGIENSFSFMYYSIMLKNEKWGNNDKFGKFGEVVFLLVFRLLEYYFDLSKCMEIDAKENHDRQDIELLDFYKNKFTMCGLFRN